MASQPAALDGFIRLESRACAGPRTATALLAAAVAVAWIASLSRSLFAPLALDHAFYQFITERVLAGQDLYRDFYYGELPGMIAIHSLATSLFGSSSLSLRLFDALWQCLTLAAMVTLGGRDGGRWRVGWLAALLYIWAYYGFGYEGTAQREGFAVLPSLLTIHFLLPTRRTEENAGWRMLMALLAGAMCFLAFAIKPTFGLGYGALWIYSLCKAWTRRHQGKRCLAELAGLTGGFVLGTAGASLGIAASGWWSGYWTTLTQEPVSSESLRGPGMMLVQLPRLGVAAVVMAAWMGSELTFRERRRGRTSSSRASSEWLKWTALGMGTFGFLLTMSSWPGWYVSVLRVCGLAVPLIGAVLIQPWAKRSPAWRMSFLLTVAAAGSLFVLGRFSGCRFAAVVAFAAYLAADEVVERCRLWPSTGDAGSEGSRAWAIMCVAAVVHLGICHWGNDLIQHSTSPCVLTDSTLDDYQARVTNAVPIAYSSELKVAWRTRELTHENDPIGILFGDPRLYVMCKRPAVHRLIWPRPGWGWYPAGVDVDFMNAIAAKRPKVLIDRMPRGLKPEQGDVLQVEQALFRDIESRYGEAGRAVRANYRVAETIDGVCILEPRPAD